MSRVDTSGVANAGVKSVSFEAVITRADGTVEDLGTVAYWHEDWWRRLAWRLRQSAIAAAVACGLVILLTAIAIVALAGVLL